MTYLSVDGNWSLKDGMHAEDGWLGRVDDGSAKHGAKDTAVADGKGATVHVLNCEWIVSRLLTKLRDGLLNVQEVHLLDIANDGHDETLGRGDGNANVNVITVDDLAALDDRIHDGLILEGKGGRLHKGRHEAKLDVVLLRKGILVLVAHLHNVTKEEVKILKLFLSKTKA